MNCPSGYDESEKECGTARRLLELPGSLFAALGCLAAALSACLFFCIFGLVRKKRKTVVGGSNGSAAAKHANGMGLGLGMNGGGCATLKADYKKDSLFLDTGS